MTKASICTQLMIHFKEELERIQTEITNTQNDISNDTKSSAGDKFETAREMAQQEIGKLQVQLQQINQTIGLITKIQNNTEKPFGTILSSSQGYFVLGVSFKRVTLKTGLSIMGIGLNAPLAQQLLNFKINNEIRTPNGSLFIHSEVE